MPPNFGASRVGSRSPNTFAPKEHAPGSPELARSCFPPTGLPPPVVRRIIRPSFSRSLPIDDMTHHHEHLWPQGDRQSDECRQNPPRSPAKYRTAVTRFVSRGPSATPPPKSARRSPPRWPSRPVSAGLFSTDPRRRSRCRAFETEPHQITGSAPAPRLPIAKHEEEKLDLKAVSGGESR